jgi:RIO-like serine/threonine protein kinase
MGYDYLALYVFTKRGSVKRVIGKVGVGKESGIFVKNKIFTKWRLGLAKLQS